MNIPIYNSFLRIWRWRVTSPHTHSRERGDTLSPHYIYATSARHFLPRAGFSRVGASSRCWLVSINFVVSLFFFARGRSENFRRISSRWCAIFVVFFFVFYVLLFIFCCLLCFCNLPRIYRYTWYESRSRVLKSVVTDLKGYIYNVAEKYSFRLYYISLSMNLLYKIECRFSTL